MNPNLLRRGLIALGVPDDIADLMVAERAEQHRRAVAEPPKREPTPVEPTLAWWRDALAGKKPQNTTQPHCGFYRRRLVKGGPWVGARIWVHQDVDAETGELVADEELRCEVGGKPRDPDDEWVWLCDQPISEADYHFLMADADWAKKHAPSSPEANPTVRTRSTEIPKLF